jgi:serine protease Do
MQSPGHTVTVRTFKVALRFLLVPFKDKLASYMLCSTVELASRGLWTDLMCCIGVCGERESIGSSTLREVRPEAIKRGQINRKGSTMSKRLFVFLTFFLVSLVAISGCSGAASSLEDLASEKMLPQVEALLDLPGAPLASDAAAIAGVDAETEAAAGAESKAMVGGNLSADSMQSSAPQAAPTADPTLASVLDALEATLEKIYVDVTPSVVNIQVVQTGGSLPSDHPGIPGFPSDPSLPEGLPPQQGLGSGFVWDAEGHIVTNNHVVEGAERITVTFSDDTSVAGEIVGTDPHSDLAVVKVDLPADQLHPVQLADSTGVRVGQLAVAIGNPFGLEGTMTVGFVSALGRSLPVASGITLGPTYTIPDIIQTDAPINPGNSGGVLVDDAGWVIGVPTAIESPVRANAGIGFAVPSAIVQRVVPALIRDGRYEHPWLGLSGTSLTSGLAGAMNLNANQRGVLVAEVVEGSPSREAGLRGSDRLVGIEGLETRVGGDVIVAINAEPVDEFDDLVTYLARSTSVGDTITLTVLRGGEEETVQVKLAARPQEEEPQAQLQREQPAVTGAWLGIQGLTVVPEIAEPMELDAGQEGVLVLEVVPDSPAGEAGLLGGDKMLDLGGQSIRVGGDIIVAVDDEPVTGMEDLLSILRGSEPGQEVVLTLLRDGQETVIEVILGERPESMP